MKTLLFVSALLVSSMSLAKSLKCDDGPSFTNKNFSINRDGAIGFNGTAIDLEGAIGLGRLESDRGYAYLSDITGRAADSDLSLTGLVLYISPKLACTNPNGGPTDSFECPLAQATIVATGTGTRGGEGAIFDRIRLSSQLTAQVSVKLEYKGATAALTGTVQANGELIRFSVPVEDTAGHCEITDI